MQRLRRSSNLIPPLTITRQFQVIAATNKPDLTYEIKRKAQPFLAKAKSTNYLRMAEP